MGADCGPASGSQEFEDQSRARGTNGKSLSAAHCADCLHVYESYFETRRLINEAGGCRAAFPRWKEGHVLVCESRIGPLTPASHLTWYGMER